jgi:hypothetical protein
VKEYLEKRLLECGFVNQRFASEKQDSKDE